MLRSKFLVLLLGLVPFCAYASDYTGFIAVMYLMIVISISTAVNIGLVISFYASSKYEDKNFAIKHASIAIIFPVIGMLLALSDHRTTEDLLYYLGFNGLASVIAVSPLFIRKIQINKRYSIGINMLVVSGVFCALSFTVFAPASVAAVITGHIATNKTQNIFRNYGVGILVLSYISVLSWLYALVRVFLW